MKKFIYFHNLILKSKLNAGTGKYVKPFFGLMLMIMTYSLLKLEIHYLKLLVSQKRIYNTGMFNF